MRARFALTSLKAAVLEVCFDDVTTASLIKCGTFEILHFHASY